LSTLLPHWNLLISHKLTKCHLQDLSSGDDNLLSCWTMECRAATTRLMELSCWTPGQQRITSQNIQNNYLGHTREIDIVLDEWYLNGSWYRIMIHLAKLSRLH
jgi:hypothetical protein